MINKERINELYKKHLHSKNNLNTELFYNEKIKHHSLYVTDTELIINSIEEDAPFHSIPVKNIHGVEEMGNHIAIVLANCILFLNKHNDNTYVHINIPEVNIWQRIKYHFQK